MTASTWTPEKVSDLVSRLTLEQKVAQLTGFAVTDLITQQPGASLDAASPELDLSLLSGLRPHGVGQLSLAWFLGHDTESLRSDLERVQAAIREVAPFGIGALVHFEGINGFLHASGSQFPTSWAQAATWEPSLVTQAATVTAAHMRATGVHLLFSPVMDLARDPRWGRVHETYGEDPELAAQFSVAFVRGIQGADGESGLLATGKHFVGYGASEGGLNQAVTQLGRRALVDEYAEPFRRAIAEAGLATVMNSYNEIDGVPCVADRWLLTELLRDQLGFTGVVVSDYDSVTLQTRFFHTADSPAQAAVQAVSAGLDVELPGDTNYSHLVEEVRGGRLDERVIDTAVTRVLAAKARAGLIPGMTAPGATSAPTAQDRGEAAAVRRAVAERGLVLLDNDGTLPLMPRGGRVVVVGPAADELRIHFGAYTSVSNAEVPLGMIAVMTGQIPGVDPATFVFTDIFQTRMPGIDDRFEVEVQRIHPDMPTVLDALRRIDPSIEHVPLGRFEPDAAYQLDQFAVEQAVAGADIVIAVVGERTGWVGNNTAGEGQSTAEPALPGDQAELIALLAATGKPLVTVVVSGRPLLLDAVAQASNAVLLAPLLGEEASEAIADAVFGLVNPSGKLPSTFPRHLGQLPVYHGHHHGSGYGHPTGTRHGYNDLADSSPLYAFGHGLSYSTFDVTLDDSAGPAIEETDGIIRARLVVTNTSTVDGETVVQLYARDGAATIVRPVRQLIGFARLALAAGQRTTATLEAPVERLFYTNLDGTRGIEAGEVTVLAGFGSDDIRCASTITLTAATA
ncbi:glycoside hydrolase family 3 N-terminal domain-containing protein [Frankia nepalensis]|uniref:Glycoside hydrolase family 3 C-terminal domain-containing protein n=3 Tax=Frankia nepalensis TaxID=1836974 RepID=A0A937REW6_9ACTN|nr:glycoside hydrolase family 3 N-terminal domain-containing protein [Frankia nepalensis]MBL7496346.1 glycoside hydrolase family 3 C-terminal domain-containing protein [Frankia nepalensis]MBL7508457.1 glycoside hydrolase family 3 C-terminal domain-containing protein [Frankia nepalensis]MBL7627589.1 glycoside hydrolase family 3 C-terminal domain-containing protein [Frankia nepalensis]